MHTFRTGLTSEIQQKIANIFANCFEILNGSKFVFLFDNFDVFRTDFGLRGTFALIFPDVLRIILFQCLVFAFFEKNIFQYNVTSTSEFGGRKELFVTSTSTGFLFSRPAFAITLRICTENTIRLPPNVFSLIFRIPPLF